MAQLWELGLRGTALDVVAAWKEVLLLVALVAAAWYVRRLPSRHGGRRACRRLRRDRRPVLASPAGLARRGRDGARRAARAPPPPPAGRGLRARPPALGALARRAARARHRADRGRGRADRPRSTSPSSRCRRGATRASPAGTATSSGSSTRASPGSPRTGSTTPGDEKNPIRRLVSTFLSPLASAYCFVVALIYLLSRPLRWWTIVLALLALRRAAVHAHACGRRCARRRPRRPRTSAQRRLAPVVARGRGRSSCPPCSSSRTRASGRRRATRRRSSSSCVRTRSPRAERARIRSRRRSRRSRATGATCATASRRCSTTRRATGSATRASSRSGRVSRSRRESRRTSSSGSTRASPVSPRSCSGACSSLLGLLREGAWVGAAFAAVLLLGLQTDVIGVHWLAVAVWAAAGMALGVGDAHEPEPRKG